MTTETVRNRGRLENGHKKLGGRPNGGENRVTREVRDALVEAFERACGVDFLLGVAVADPSTLCRLLARLVPNEIAARVEAGILVKLIDMSDTRSDDLTSGDLDPVEAGAQPLDLRGARAALPSRPVVIAEATAPAAPLVFPAPLPDPAPVPPPAAPSAPPILLRRPALDDFEEWAD